jgi:transglutaminase-like putative cysteine protease
MRRQFVLAALVFCAVHARSVDMAGHPLTPAGLGLRSGPVSLLPERDTARTARGCAQFREEANPASDDVKLSLYLRKATGSLTVPGSASSDTYQIYFHIPIPFHEQAPILLEMACPQMIDYRFVQEDPPNMLVAARIANATSTELDWTAWVLVKQNLYLGFPSYVPIPTPAQLPDSVRQWLDTTDCCQVSAPVVQYVAESLRDTATNLMKFARNVCDFCYNIPWQFPHTPVAFDAVYALKWGNSCTGHAHAAAALLRAGGVPARTLLNMPVSASNYDMHWIIDYYVPGYGWVRMESSNGQNPVQPQDELVVRTCKPGDEYPVWYPYGIDAEWHTSDTAFGIPGWGGAHNALAVLAVSDSTERADYAVTLTKWVFGCHTAYCGIRLTPAQQAAFASGLGHQTSALARIQASDLPGYIIAMEEALIDYQNVNPAPVETFFSEDFENGPVGWTHGGSQDEWELGVPTYGPASAHSGANCWGTNLDGPYANNDDCWLESPQVDLSGLASANLSFWVWNSVQDMNGYRNDPVWVEISRDGTTFCPLSSWMGGVNDDPEITAVGGWSRVFLDLAQYLGDTVRLRFGFRSDNSIVFAGSYIDDVRITGRRASSGIAEAPSLTTCTPDRLPTIVRGVLELAGDRGPGTGDRAALLDISGRRMVKLQPGANDVRHLAPGVYFVYESETDGRRKTGIRKVILEK